jgi:NADH-quinone oxidoreductase subunit J
VVKPREFGRFLFERYWLAVEIISLLLLIALVAAIQLRRGQGGEE